jgi:hypothetical protein
VVGAPSVDHADVRAVRELGSVRILATRASSSAEKLVMTFRARGERAAFR